MEWQSTVALIVGDLDDEQVEWLRSMVLSMEDVDDVVDLVSQLSDADVDRIGAERLRTAAAACEDTSDAITSPSPTSAPPVPPIPPVAAPMLTVAEPTTRRSAVVAARSLSRQLRNEYEWLLSSLPCTGTVKHAVKDLDGAIVEYLRSVCRDADVNDTAGDVLSVLRDILPAAFEGGAGTAANAVATAKRVIHAAQGGAAAGRMAAAPPTTATVSAQRIARARSRAAPTPSPPPSPERVSVAEAEAAGVQALLELHPSVEPDVLRAVLMEHASGDVATAARLTLEDDALLARVAARLERDTAAARDEAEREAQARRATNKRFGHIVARARGEVAPSARPRVAEDGSVNGEGKGNKSRTKRGGRSKVRYRDSLIVTRTGDRAAQPKVEVDAYDGGSRGRVKTKGKRGKGFV